MTMVTFLGAQSAILAVGEVIPHMKAETMFSGILFYILEDNSSARSRGGSG
jgi:hypothetical protein